MTAPARRYYSLAFRAAITVAVLTAVLHQIDLHRTVIQWRDAEWAYVIVLGPLVSLACLFINALRWRLILAHQGLRPPFINVAVIYTKAAFFGSFLPGGMTTGDIFRVRLLAKKTQDLAASIKSVLLDRASGLFGLLIVALAALLYSYVETDGVSLRPLLRPVIVLIFSGLTMAAGLYALHNYFQKLYWQHPLLLKLRSFLDMVPQYFEDKSLIVKEVSLSLVLQLVILGWIYIVAKALHISVSFGALAIATPLVTLFSLLPISLGGIGIREAGYVFFLVPFGITAGEATSLSLVSGLVQDALRLAFGFIVFWEPFRGFTSDGRGARRTEANSTERI
jgi:uncharacterized protein (TIRG00374 family)